MNRDLELAEMVVNEEIDLEEAKKLADDVTELMRCVSLRRSMRYALQSAMLYYRRWVMTTNAVYADYAYAQYLRLVNGYSNAALVDLGGLYEAEGMITDAAKELGLRFLEDDLVHLSGASGQLGLNLDPEDPAYKDSVTVGEFYKEIVYPAGEKASRWMVRAAKEGAKAGAYSVASFAQAVGESIQMLANALLY